jgi:hypothetical protein
LISLAANVAWNPSSSSHSHCRKTIQKHRDYKTYTMQSNDINNIQHTIGLVTKPKLDYI